MKVNIKDTEKNCISKIIRIISEFSPKHLTEIEVDTLTEFLLIDDKFKNSRFSAQAKRKILDKLKETNSKVNMQTIHNRIYSLQAKNYIFRDSDFVLSVAPNIEKIIQKFKYEKKVSFEIYCEALHNTNSSNSKEA